MSINSSLQRNVFPYSLVVPWIGRLVFLREIKLEISDFKILPYHLKTKDISRACFSPPSSLLRLVLWCVRSGLTWGFGGAATSKLL